MPASKRFPASKRLPLVTLSYPLRSHKRTASLSAMDETPIGLQLQKIHKFLSTELESFTSQDILKRTGVDIDRSPQIFLSLTDDKSKVLREHDGKWRWASKYQVKDFNSLIALIGRSYDGVCEKDLLDSYKGVKEDIKKLREKDAIMEMKSGSKVLLFPQHENLQSKVSDKMKEIYSKVSLPDEIEIHRYLVTAGIKKTDDVTGIKISQPVARKRPGRRNDKKRRAKKIKLTNTHMTGSNIDLSKDFNTGKDSAFN